MNLIEAIINNAQDDLYKSNYQSELINNLYDNSTEIERKTINLLLIYLCGWELPSLRELIAYKTNRVNSND